jgi:hypothetical protein
MATRDFIILKYSAEKWAIGFRFFPPDLNEAETISSVETEISPADGNLSKVGDPSIDQDKVSQVIQGGASGQTYEVYFEVTTSVGFIFKDKITIKVR